MSGVLSQRLHARRGALDKGVVDHDVRKAAGRVQELEPSRPPRALVGRPPTVGVLPEQQQVDRVAQPVAADRLVDQFCQREAGLDTLCRAIGNRPAVRPGREGPPAAGGIPVVALALRHVFANLVAIEKAMGLADQRSVFLGATGGDHRLTGERQIPQLRRVVPLHLEPVVGLVQVVVESVAVGPQLRAIGTLEVPDQRVV